MLYLIDVDLYEKFQKNKRFQKINGNNYQEYILNSINLSNNIRIDILNSKSAKDSLKILCNNQISFTHSYPESIIMSEDNIKLTIIDKDTLLIN